MKVAPFTKLSKIVSLLILYTLWVSSLSAKDEAKEDVALPLIVCFGDSITKRGYGDILAKSVGARAINAGVAGHNTAQGLSRIQKDVIDQNPDIVVIFFGTNDLRVDSIKHVKFRDYKNNLTQMIKKIKKADAKVVVCTLPPINETVYYTRHEKAVYDTHGGLTDLIDGYRSTAMEVAEKNEVALVDLNQLLLKNPEWLSPDGVHPSAAGTRIIAKLIEEKAAPLLEEISKK